MMPAPHGPTPARYVPRRFVIVEDQFVKLPDPYGYAGSMILEYRPSWWRRILRTISQALRLS